MKHLLFSALIVCTFSMQAQLVINEVAPNNAQQYDDEDHTYPDWIEIMNTGAITINLAGYALTDDLDVWNQWLLPSTNLLAGDKVIATPPHATDLKSWMCRMKSKSSPSKS